MLTRPPDVCFDDGDGKPRWFDLLDGDHYGVQLMCGVRAGRLELKKTQRGTDLLVSCKREDLKVSDTFFALVDTMRGFRAVQSNRNVGRYHYQKLDADRPNHYFACSLAPGNYEVEELKDGASLLYWRDTIGVKQTPTPQLEPEVMLRYNFNGFPLRRRPKAMLPQPTPAPEPQQFKRKKLPDYCVPECDDIPEEHKEVSVYRPKHNRVLDDIPQEVREEVAAYQARLRKRLPPLPSKPVRRRLPT